MLKHSVKLRCYLLCGCVAACCSAANYTLVILDHSLIFRLTITDAASIQFNLLMMSIRCSKHVEDHNKRIVK